MPILAFDGYLGGMSGTRLVIFARAPRPGTLKTRLARAIGPEAACTAYRQLVEHLLPRVLPAGMSVVLRFTPDDAEAEMAPWLRSGWKLAPQGEGDLGARMLRAVADSVAAGYQRTIIIGTDCPYLTSGDLHEAANALETNDVVIGPATDGGYWLIAVKQPHACLFEDMPWGRSTVAELTAERANQAGLVLRRLRTLSDIDTVTDWETWLRQLPPD